MQEPIPMDVDEGPKPRPDPTTHMMASIPATITKEEEARQAIEYLRHNDLAARVAASHRLDAVAKILGPERTRTELLPFITDGTDDEDEVLLALAGSLGRMVEAIGGPDHAHLLLQPLEVLLMVEEAAVREKAIDSFKAIFDILPTVAILDECAPLLSRLATKQWFTARISAASLMAYAYPKLDAHREEHLDLFCRLCRDDTPMVRRVAAQYLGVMVQNVVRSNGRATLDEDGAVSKLLIPLYEQMSTNEQPDSVRLQTTQNCVAFGSVLAELEPPLKQCELALLSRILPLLLNTIDDRSWRVRWTAAAKFSDVVSVYQNLPGNTMDSLVTAYEKLLQDPEAEVRTAATLNLAHVCRCRAQVSVSPSTGQGSDVDLEDMGPRCSVAERLVKRVTSLTEDDSEHVRAALAMVATELAPVLGTELTIAHLVPPVLLLLRDAASEVRLNLISSLDALNEVIGVDLLSQSLLPAILDLAQDGKWRIRWAIIQHIPLLAEQLGREFFTDRLTQLCVRWLGDDIATIRRAATANLKSLTALFGTDWAIRYLLPSIQDIRESDSYLRRLTALHAFSMIAGEMEAESVKTRVLPLVLEMANDIVPNIRFNVAKELHVLAKVCGAATFEAQILPVLSMLMNDEDRDVRYYAEKTASSLEEEFAAS